MNTKTWAQLGLAVVLLGVAAWMMSGVFSGPPINMGPYQALGTVAAEEAAAMVGGSGRLVLIVPDPGPEGDPVQEGQVAAFRKELGRHQGVELEATEVVAMDPMTRMQTGGAVPPSQYVAIRARHAGATGFVLFLPFPPMGEAELAEAGKGKAKVLVVSPALPGYEALLRAGAFQVALVPRAEPAEGTAGAAPGSARAVFDREYVVMR
ncbi:MAG: hypothetical protein IT580_14855 [Verrucomicrobiales bacterium]|nr:hypothetical protein [Verrucomicrobiales bacterium]